MSVYRIIMIALLALAPMPQQAALQDSLASIHGVVVDAATGEPVVGAAVELTGIQRNNVLSVYDITDKNGRFAIPDVQPGSEYQLTATDPGEYLAGAYGQPNPHERWKPLTVTAGQKLEVRLILTPVGKITGKVVDANNRPLRRATVTVLRATYDSNSDQRGVRVLQQAGDTTNTGDDGRYFVGGLGTGQYYIRVNVLNSGDNPRYFENPTVSDALTDLRNDPTGFPTTYYPAAMDLLTAKPVDLLNGGKVEQIDIRVTSVRTHRVRGTVAFEGEGQHPSVKNVILVPRSAGTRSSFTRIIKQPKDTFEFRGVIPGPYYLIAIAGDERSQFFGRQLVEVGDANIEKLNVTLRRGVDISGTIRFADWPGGVPPDYSQLAIRLVPNNRNPIDVSHSGTMYTANLLTVVPTSSGAFTMRNIAPGDYRISLALNPGLPATAKVPIDLKTAYLKSAQLQSADILTAGFKIDGPVTDSMQVVIATNSGSIFGRVLGDDKQPIVPARAMIVPDPARRSRFDLFSPIAVTPTGRFRLDGIPPGDYKVFAWAHVEEGSWFDPEFMRVYENHGVPIHIDEAGTYPVEIPLSH